MRVCADNQGELTRWPLQLIKLPMIANTCKADVRAIRRHINSNTIAIVGSCPQYPHGAVDPITELAALAKSHDIGLHVDCCLGSFVVPFMRKAGFDFPGESSRGTARLRSGLTMAVRCRV